LVETLMQDMGVYYNAYWLKLRAGGRIGLLRLPPEQVAIQGVLSPQRFIWTSLNGSRQEFPPDDVVHFGGYDPENPLAGLSPLETLRRILAQEIAANEYRQHFWANAARIEGVIERPATAPKWDADQRATFRDSWQAAHAGIRNSGKAAILEDGMTWKQNGFSAQESEYAAARKLTAEECARAYHIPLPMVGILDHATFSNIKEQHKNLYQDSLGPWLEMIVQELQRQVLPEFTDVDRVYCEFNIAAKLAGSFEEQAASLRTLIGRPIMTPNEGRGRLNLPSLDDPTADQLAAPLNMANPGGDPRFSDPALDAPEASAWATTVRAFWSRQESRVQKDPPGERGARFALGRWNTELAAALLPHLLADARVAPAVAAEAAAQYAALINAETQQWLHRGANPFRAGRPVPALEADHE